MDGFKYSSSKKFADLQGRLEYEKHDFSIRFVAYPKESK